MTRLLFLLFVFISLVSGQSEAPSCDHPPGRGQDGPDKGIRYFYDNVTNDCYPFLYRGAGANNEFHYGRCNLFCKSPHPFKCVGGPSTGECSLTDRKCPNPGDNCHSTVTSETGTCCDAKTDAEYKAERFPTCTTGFLIGKETINNREVPLLGRSCDDQFCPENSYCVQGKYLAHCCTECGLRPTLIARGPTMQLRWIYDQKLADCVPYSGVDYNNFPTYEDCMDRCYIEDHIQCAFDSPSTGQCGRVVETVAAEEKCPNPNDECYMSVGTIGICCDAKLEAEFSAERKPTCPGHMLVTRTTRDGNEVPFLGARCSDLFCPSSSECYQGKYWAHCCITNTTVNQERQ